VKSALFATPRPEPGHLLPTLGGAVVIAIALPVFLVAGWRVSGWALAACLWAAAQVVNVLIRRARGSEGNLAASAVQGFGLFFKALALLVVLFAAVASDPGLAVAAAVTYALAYTFELGLSLLAYFGRATT
jgi:hypothetical protein